MGQRIFVLRRALTGLLLFIQVRDVRFYCTHVLAHLDQDAHFQLHFVAILDFVQRSPVVVTDEVSLIIIYHHTLVELVVA